VVNKTELIDKLASATSLSKADAGRTVDALFDVDKGIIADTLKAGAKVQITGFGTFETRRRGARTGRNPRTGETIQIPASMSPAFRPGKGLKDGLK
jgi:DNA-binding protein HU-beta